ncbi:MAG: hypothetical protein ACOC0P_00295 [Planctomycetota bacterium]
MSGHHSTGHEFNGHLARIAGAIWTAGRAQPRPSQSAADSARRDSVGTGEAQQAMRDPVSSPASSSTGMIGGSVAALLLMLLGVLMAPITGCTSGMPADRVNPSLHASYDETMVWTIAPIINESGVSIVNTIALADTVAAEAQRVRGIDVIPVQRVLDGMRALDIGRVETVTDAQSLARLVGADAIIVGTLTSYDPYNPPQLGMTLQLYTVGRNGDGPFDTRQLSMAPSDRFLPGGTEFEQPVATSSQMFDGSDNGTRLDLERFASGRTLQMSAFGWEKYLLKMDLFAEYAANRLLADLLSQERTRIAYGGQAPRDW